MSGFEQRTLIDSLGAAGLQPLFLDFAFAAVMGQLKSISPQAIRLLMVPEQDEILSAILNKEPANNRLFWVRRTGLSSTAVRCLYA